VDAVAQLTQSLAGRYNVERKIGAGGMATVYLARDLRHERRVALKVLNSELGAVLGTERFLREIRVTANLQHPNLLPLFESGDADGLLYYVMPFVEGESLRARLDREKQLSVDEAVRIAVAVGNALDYAHELGVIHRDLKPENILLQHGQPIVADFGIALAISNAGGGRITQTGLSLGTPQYMSPEQASGDRVIDGRSDIYSLGATLYEMLAGEPPHVGNTVQAIIAKVLTDKPRALRLTRDTVPVRVELAVEKALSKLPADRFARAEQFVRALEGDGTGFEKTQAAATSHARTPWIRHPASIVTTVAALSAAALVWFVARRPPPAERTVRFTLAPPPGSRVWDTYGPLVAISPDGRRIVYVGEGQRGAQLWIRGIDDAAPRLLPGTDNPIGAIFTPDGRSIVYLRLTDMHYVRISADGGGVPVPLFTGSTGARITWMGSDSLVYSAGLGARDQHLFTTSMNGGTPKRFFTNDSTGASVVQADPYLAPDGETLFFTSAERLGGDLTIAVTTLATRKIEVTKIPARLVLGYRAGRLIYAQDDGTIMTVAFDLRARRAVGQPVATSEVAQADTYTIKAFLSERGDLTYSPAGSLRMVLSQGNGTSTRLTKEEREFAFPRLSPDGLRVAVAIGSGPRIDVWILNMRSGDLARLTTGGTVNERPEWSPDGRHVLFRSNRDGAIALWWQLADGSAPAERLTPVLPWSVQEGVLSPDGQTLLYRVDAMEQGSARDIYPMSMTDDRTPRPFLTTEFDELTPRFSPDGHWVAYVSNESARDEVYVRPFPGPGGRVLISGAGGQEPIWSHDGTRIFYRTVNTVMAASISWAGTPSVVRRDTVLVGPYRVNRVHPSYDVTRDGHLLMLESAQEAQPTIILNWAQSLDRTLRPAR
jgi:serine/threonine-protein kinase